MRLALTDTATLLDRLEVHFQRPAMRNEELHAQQVRDYHEALQFFPREVVEGAVASYIRKESRYWPKVAALVNLCRERTTGNGHAVPVSDHARWLADPFAAGGTEESAPCPVCGSVWRWLHRQRADGTWTPARLHIRCDEQRHRENGTRAITTYQPGDEMRPADPALGDNRTLKEIERDLAVAFTPSTRSAV